MFEQRRIIYTPENEENTKVPVMPLIVMLEDGTMGEARSMRGAVTLIVGNEYLDSEDEITDWHLRVEAARRFEMNALKYNVESIVWDSRKGIIRDNYAVDEDPDYEIEGEPEKIRVDNERLLLLSLMKLGLIKVMEREDSYFLRPHDKWEQVSGIKCCGTCWHRKEDNEKLICYVYNQVKDKTAGNDCSTYMFNAGEYKEYKGGTYIDLAAEYNIDDMIAYFENR